jgi:hypothetical protein
MLEEAIELAPKEGRWRLVLADRLLNVRAAEQAKAQLEAALRVDPGTWRDIFQFWVQRRDPAQARALVAQAEASGMLDPAFLVDGGLHCLRLAEDLAPQARMARGKAAKGQPRLDPAWAALSRELLDRAATLDPSLDQLQDLVGYLLVPHPALALPYAERCALLAPSDPRALMDLAVAQSGAGQAEAAAQTLLKVERVARTLKDRQEAADLLGLVRMFKDSGVKGMHASFCRFTAEEEWAGSGGTPWR